MLTLTFPFFSGSCGYAILYHHNITIKQLTDLNMSYDEYKEKIEHEMAGISFVLKTTHKGARLISADTSINLISNQVELYKQYTLDQNGYFSGWRGNLGRLDQYNGSIWHCPYMLIAA